MNGAIRTDHRGGVLRGIGASPGIAIGRVLVLEGPRTPIVRLDRTPEQAEREVVRFSRAIRGAWRQLRALRDRVRSEAGESYARVFEAQILILKDRSLFGETVNLIRGERVNAEWAFHSVVGRFIRIFQSLGDQDVKERGTDVEDVEARVQSILGGGRRIRDLDGLDEEVILATANLSPSDAAALNRRHVIGLALDFGGATSHTAIIATGMGIPAVSGLRDGSRRLRSGDRVVLDGCSGTIVVEPDDEELRLWHQRRDRLAQRDRDRSALRELPAVTLDGSRIRLMANIELLDETLDARRWGAEGIGLFRSEFLEIRGSDHSAAEEIHFDTYRQLVERTRPHEVVIRTLDSGGEHEPVLVAGRADANPALGMRGIRHSLKNRESFRAQLRGILRAGSHGRVRVLLPMVGSVEEVREARGAIREASESLAREGIPFDPSVPVGIMIEVPAAVMIADRLAHEVDFFSVGTNDLIQYVLAVDRTNESVAFLHRPLHPAILRMLRRVAEAGERGGLRVSVCGEMAADPLAAVVLLGLGFSELSVTPAAIPGVKEVIRRVPMSEARSIAAEALGLDTAGEIEDRVRDRILALLPAEYACPI